MFSFIKLQRFLVTTISLSYFLSFIFFYISLTLFSQMKIIYDSLFFFLCWRIKYRKKKNCIMEEFFCLFGKFVAERNVGIIFLCFQPMLIVIKTKTQQKNGKMLLCFIKEPSLFYGVAKNTFHCHHFTFIVWNCNKKNKFPSLCCCDCWVPQP